jgi:hypothetical protein
VAGFAGKIFWVFFRPVERHPGSGARAGIDSKITSARLPGRNDGRAHAEMPVPATDFEPETAVLERWMRVCTARSM